MWPTKTVGVQVKDIADFYRWTAMLFVAVADWLHSEPATIVPKAWWRFEAVAMAIVAFSYACYLEHLALIVFFIGDWSQHRGIQQVRVRERRHRARV